MYSSTALQAVSADRVRCIALYSRILLQSRLHWIGADSLLGPTHGRRLGERLRPTSSSPALSFARRTARDLPSPPPAAPCMPRSRIFARRRVGAPPSRRGASAAADVHGYVVPRTSQLDERSERLRLALSAAGKLQHRLPRRSPPYGNHVASRVPTRSLRPARTGEGLSAEPLAAVCLMKVEVTRTMAA